VVRWKASTPGMPICRCTASAVSPSVMVPTTPKVSHRVTRPNLRPARVVELAELGDGR
jgi:hypothetical protein